MNNYHIHNMCVYSIIDYLDNFATIKYNKKVTTAKYFKANIKSSLSYLDIKYRIFSNICLLLFNINRM